MGFVCPRCGADDLNEEVDGDPRILCTGCNNCWKPEQEPRLLETEPRRRRDLE